MTKSIVIFFLLLFTHLNSYSQCLLLGADLSYVNTIEDSGGVYFDSSGIIVDPYQLFSNFGADIVRLRLWHSPENNTNFCGSPITSSDLQDVVESSQRARNLGMQVKLSIHYSDYFADPSKQQMPLAWQGLSDSDLLDSIFLYTYKVLEVLWSNSALPNIVSIGNETTWGFIDTGSTTDGWNWNLDKQKFNRAFEAIDLFNDLRGKNIQKAVHFTESTALFMLNEFNQQGINNFDIIGFSYYPNFSPSVSLMDVGSLITQLKSGNSYQVMIFETGFCWNDDSFADNYNNFINDNGSGLSYSISEMDQLNYLNDLASTVYNHGGDGLIYWEPAWISSNMCDLWGQGSAYENVSFFDFTDNNSALRAFEFYGFCESINSVRTIDELDLRISYSNSNIFIESNRFLNEIKIYNLNGKLVEAMKVQSKLVSFELRDRTGIFFVYAFDGQSRAAKKVFVF